MGKVNFGILVLFMLLALSLYPGQEEKEQISVLNQLAQKNRRNQPAKAIKYASRALQRARKIRYRPAQALALEYLGDAYFYQNNASKTIEYTTQALAIYRDLNDKQGMGRTLNILGLVNYYANKYRQALVHFQESLTLRRSGNRKDLTAESLFNIGNVHAARGQFAKALKVQLEALTLMEASTNKNALADAYASVGLLYFDLKQPSKALPYLERALKYKLRFNDPKGLATIYNNMATLLMEQKKYDRALDYYRKALEIRRKLGDKAGAATVTDNIGLIHLKRKNYKKALQFQQQAFNARKPIANQRDLAYSYLHMGSSLYGMKRYKEALQYLQKSELAAKKLESRDRLQMEIHRGRVNVYFDLKNYKKAYENFRLLYAYEKKLLGENSQKQFNRLQSQYEAEKRQREIDLLKKDNELKIRENEVLKINSRLRDAQIKQNRLQRNMFVGGLILALIILWLLMRKYLHLFAFWKKIKTIGQYRLLDPLGSGAMGTVYKAHRLVDKKQLAAVKILKEELFNDETSRTRFKREAAIIDKLNHPNIVTVYERGQTQDALFIAMELLDGRPLDRFIAEETAVPLDRCLNIMKQTASALACIHEQNIIHRDLKPANIMISEKEGQRDFVKVLDFGLAREDVQSRLTQTGDFVGTLEYISPEQLLNAKTAPANDIFSLGVIYYRLLTGIGPFTGESPIEIMRRIIQETPSPPSHFREDVPPQLDKLILSMIAKDPEQRPKIENIVVFF